MIERHSSTFLSSTEGLLQAAAERRVALLTVLQFSAKRAPKSSWYTRPLSLRPYKANNQNSSLQMVSTSLSRLRMKEAWSCFGDHPS